MSQYPYPPPHGSMLPYQSPGGYQRPSTGRPVLQFFGGLGAGTLLSLIAWALGFGAVNSASDGGTVLVAMLFLVPTAKLATGITFLCLRPYRLLGGGIMASLAIGALIFFGMCANAVKF